MLNTYPCNPFPISSEQLHKGDNEDLQAQINAIKDGSVIDSFGDVETALDTVKSGLTNLDNEVNGDATTYPYADVITIEDAVPANLADCSVKIEPVQDLHGYDKPWVGGAGKNKLPMIVADIKSWNTIGTWNVNVYTHNGVTFTVLTDDGDNVTGIKVTGTASANINFVIAEKPVFDGQAVMSGCPSNGSDSTYFLQYSNNMAADYKDVGSGISVSQFDYATYPDSNVKIQIRSGYACPTAGLKFYPMISLATETDDTFAPYTNICPISGHTEASVEVTDGDETAKTYTIALGSAIYGGTVDFDSGVMTVTHANIVSYNGETIGEPWISSMDEYTQGGTPTTGAQVVYTLATPQTIQLTPQQIQLLKGQNTLTASTGQISVTANGVSGSIGAVQEQVNELGEDVALKQNATDNNLQTTDKTVVGAVNELKSGLTNLMPIKVTGHTPVTQGLATWNDSGIDFTNRYVAAFYIITAGDNTPYYMGQGAEGISLSVNPTTNKPQIYIFDTADAKWKDVDCFAILV